LSFDFLHQGLSSGAVPLDFVDFLCSGTNVTTTHRHCATHYNPDTKKTGDSSNACVC